MDTPSVGALGAVHAVEGLLKLARHDDADIRAWALRRIAVTDPSAGLEAAAEGLKDRAAEVRREAVALLARVPGEFSRRALAGALRDGRLRIDAIEALGAAGGRDALPELERIAAAGREDERAAAWRAIHGIDAARALSAIREEWRRKGAARVREPWVSLLMEFAAPEDAGLLIERLHAERDDDVADGLMQSLLAGCGSEDASPWGETWKDRPDRKFERARAERDGLPVDEWRRVIDLLHRRDWPGVVDGALSIAGRGPESAWRRETAARLRERPGWNEIDGWIAMGLAMGACRRRPADATLSPLRIEAVDSEAPDDLLDRIRFWFKSHPDELRAAAEAHLESSEGMRVELLLDALGECPAGWVSGVILRRLVGLLDSDHRASALGALMESGDPASIEPLVREWRPGERGVARAFSFLSRIAGRPEILTDEMKRDAEPVEVPDPRELSVDTAWERLASEGHTFELKCLRCGRVGMYDVPRIFIDPTPKSGPDGVVLGRVIECKYCGAVDEYALAGRSYLAVMAAAALVLARKEPADLDDPVCIGTPALHDGFRYRRPSEAIAHLREKANKRPKDPEPWLRLGNFLRRHDRAGEAEEAYRRAESLDAAHAELLYNLMTLLLEQGRPEEAWEYLRRAIESLPKARREIRANLAVALVAHLEEASKQSAMPMWLHAAWMGEPTERKETVMLSAVELKRLRRWDRLGTFLEERDLKMVTFSADGPPDRPTILEKLLEGSAARGEPNVVTYDLGGRKTSGNTVPQV